jgi:prephenate dehydrogenase
MQALPHLRIIALVPAFTEDAWFRKFFCLSSSIFRTVRHIPQGTQAVFTSPT